MNQVLIKKNNSFKMQQRKYKIILFICISICIISIIIYILIKYNMMKNDEISKNLTDAFSLTTLYSSNSTNEYSAQQLTVAKEPFVIGLIQIDKIKLIYPILSETSPELLKLAPCRYFGPMPNEPRESLYCWSQLC